jgi:hypothetical protein
MGYSGKRIRQHYDCRVRFHFSGLSCFDDMTVIADSGMQER